MSAPAPFTLRYDPFGRFVLETPAGERWVGVVPVRCFPFTAAGGPLAFVDESGREVFEVPALDALPGELRALVEAELARREFLPEIQSVNAISAPPMPVTWDVETDRGPARFTLKSDDQVRSIAGQGLLIIDTRGVRWRIRDARKLDRRSRRLLDDYL